MKKPTMICFSGASGSGKTTTMEKVKKALLKKGYSVFMFKENIRGVVKNIDEVRKDANKYFDIQKMIVVDKITTEDKIFKENNFDFILTDRALSDSMFYYSFYVDRRKLNKKNLKDYYILWDILNKDLDKHFKEIYSMVVCFKPFEFDIDEIGPMRPSDINKSKHIEDLFINAINFKYENSFLYENNKENLEKLINTIINERAKSLV